MKKVFREKFSFNKADFRGTVGLGMSGVNTCAATPAALHHNYKDFDTSGFSFGNLWSSINDPKFYEGLNASDVVPKEEDFVEVTFRLISATTVGAGSWKATDFTNAKVLKSSMDKLNGKPIYKDHETDLDNWVGLIKGTKWSPETTQNGVKIPAGIDGLMLIDAKTNPKIARGLLLGSIFSNSVTVDFEWEMSHDFENEDDFYYKVGQMGADGKMIRRVVKNIYDYYETSLVWLGADPFAKSRDADGNLMHVDTSGVYEYSKKEGLVPVNKVTFSDLQDNEKEEFKNSKKLKINFALEKNVLSLMRKDVSQENPDEMKNKFLLAFIAAFGNSFGITEETPETEFEEKLKKLSLMSEEDKNALQLGSAFVNAASAFLGEGQVVDAKFVENHSFVSNTDLEAFKKAETELDKATKEIQTLKAEKITLEADAKVGKEYSKQRVEAAKKFYKLQVGEENADANVLAMFDKAKPEEVEGLLKSYTKGVTEKFSGTCSSCGSKEFKFQSTFIADNGSEDTNDDAVVTADDFRNKYRKGAFAIGRNAEDN